MLSDLAIEAVHRELRPVYRLLERQTQVAGARGREWDFVLRSGRENLAQALILRLLTPRGELAALGHPEYGARVHELIGQRNTSSVRNLLKLFIIDALRFEPRVEKVTALEVTPSPGTRSTVDVRLEVLPKTGSEPLQIGPFSIDLAS